jgi:hypothetical protein
MGMAGVPVLFSASSRWRPPLGLQARGCGFTVKGVDVRSVGVRLRTCNSWGIGGGSSPVFGVVTVASPARSSGHGTPDVFTLSGADSFKTGSFPLGLAFDEGTAVVPGL